MKQFATIFISILLGIGAAHAQNADKKVTFECKAGPADQVFKALSTAAGTILACDATMRKEIILISIKDAPFTQLLDKIAKVTSGRWIENGGEYRLAANTAERQKQLDAWNALSITRIKDAVAAAAVSTPVPAVKLAALQDPATLAAIGPGQRTVFSSSPNSEQHALIGITDEMVNTLVQGTQAVPVADSQAAGAGQSQDTAKAKERAPSVVLLSVARKGIQFELKITVYDGRGYTLTNSLATVVMPTYIPPRSEIPTTSPLTTAPGEALKLSPLTQEAIQGGFLKGAKSQQFSKELQQALLHPDRVDPLSFLASDAILQRAHECGEQLVADLPDCVAWAPVPSDAKTFLKGELDRGDVQLSEDQGWVALSPGDPVEARYYRANRKALAELLVSANSSGVASIDDLAAFAVAEGHPPVDALSDLPKDASMPYLISFVPDWDTLHIEANQLNLLLLYAGLSPDQREALMGGKPLEFGSLTSESQSALREIIFGADSTFTVELPKSIKASDQVEVDQYRGRFGRFVQTRVIPGATLTPGALPDYLEEPTEALADGILPQGTMSMVSGDAGSRFRFVILPPVSLECAVAAHKAGNGEDRVKGKD